jgi:hypothetical protein
MSGEEDCGLRRSRNLSPLRGFFYLSFLTLGLTPQANNLSRLRRSVQ